MKLAILYSSNEGSESSTIFQAPRADPSAYSKEQTFERHYISKAHAKRDIEAIVLKEYEFFINFMDTQDEGPAARIERVRTTLSLSS